ncbi:MAG: hypothetical protein JSR46_04800 [Verrucomicrobia bacterium]|nr:hypothetical protein [Verrucomicrobiota bacterium]
MSADAELSKYGDVAGDMANWNAISQVKPGQKIQIANPDGLGKGEVSVSIGTADVSSQRISRNLLHIFSTTIAEVKSTVTWMEAFQNKTAKDIEHIAERIDSPAARDEDVQDTLRVLRKLRKSIAAAQTGFEHLQETYKGRGDINSAFAQQQSNSTKLLAQIDRITQETAARNGTIGILQGRESVDVKKTWMEFGNERVEVPGEVKTELTREYVAYNGEVLTSTSDPSLYQPVKAYRTLNEKVGSNNITDVLLLLCGQASVASVTIAATELALEKLGNVSPEGSRLNCFITVKGDKTVITLITRMCFKDMDNLDERKVKGYVVVTREITIPNESLEKLKSVEYSKIKEMDDPLPGMTVIDSHTDILPTEEEAIRAQEQKRP